MILHDTLAFLVVGLLVVLSTAVLAVSLVSVVGDLMLSMSAILDVTIWTLGFSVVTAYTTGCYWKWRRATLIVLAVFLIGWTMSLEGQQAPGLSLRMDELGSKVISRRALSKATSGYLDPLVESKMAEEMDKREQRVEMHQLEHVDHVDQVDHVEVSRGRWSSPSDFLLTSVGYAVGLGNVWRFPILCERHGSIFLLVYWLMVVLMGVPILFLEMAIGQLARNGPIRAFHNLTPLLAGLGYSMVQVGLLFSFFYTVIVSWSLHYVFSTLATLPSWTLPWSTCDNAYNSEKCTTEAPFNNTFVSSAQEFFVNNVLHAQHARWDNFGWPRVSSMVCLMCSWLLVALCLLKGIRVSKAPRIMALTPYLMLIAIGSKSLTLPGSVEGVKTFLDLNNIAYSDLLKSQVWLDAATQIIFSLGPACGCVITLASYNDAGRAIFKDACLVALINGGTSMLCGLLVFSIIGFVRQETNLIEIEGGPGLAFVLYPQVVSRMQGAPLLALLFFLMLVSMALSSIFGALETVVAGLQDIFPHYLLNQTSTLVLSISLVLCVASIPFAAPGGVHLLTLFNACGPSFNILVLCLLEMLVVSLGYGLNNFLNDLREVGVQIGAVTSVYIRLCWTLVTPVALALLILCGQFGQVGLGDYVYPMSVQMAGLAITFSTLLCIPIIAIRRIYQCHGDKERLTMLLSPNQEWRETINESHQQGTDTAMRNTHV